MDKELTLARRVAELQDSQLTESDVHTFLLNAADLLDCPPLQVLGPGIHFRWIIGERVFEINV